MIPSIIPYCHLNSDLQFVWNGLERESRHTINDIKSHFLFNIKMGKSNKSYITEPHEKKKKILFNQFKHGLPGIEPAQAEPELNVAKSEPRPELR